MITLRPYQEQCIAGLRGAFAAGYHSPLLVSPTGSGKTVMFSYLTDKLVRGGKRVVLLCHRDELVDQISRTLSDFSVPHGNITAGCVYDRRLLAHDASVFTLARRLDRVAVPDYVICDEAHHGVAGSTWGKVIAYWRQKNPKLRVIGVTATPERLSGEGLGETFDEMILGPTTRELIDLGALCEYRLFAPQSQIDLSGVHMQAGDFNRKELGALIDKPAIVGDTVKEYVRLLNGAPSVAFCVSIEHATHVAENFRSAGFRAVSIDGKMDKAMRREIVRDFGRGQINVMTSCSLIDEGFDCPGIVGVIDLSPTWSLARCLQRWGRGFRPFAGKDAAIFMDQVNNSGRHGLPDDPREWSLLGRDARKGKKKDEDNVACRQCPECYAVSPAAASKCRDCGKPFPIKARKIEEVAGTLSEVEVARMRRQSAREQAAAETLEDLIRIGTQRGFKNAAGWARHVYEARQAKRAG
jgi:DNA repair protein RadD